MRESSRTRGPRAVLLAALAASVAFLALADDAGAGELEPTFVLGDVDCDGELTSLDAVFVLQFGAGLLDALPCPDNGDTSGDALTNSVDAGLILQHTAGLVDDFVTFALAVHRPEGVCDESSVPVTCDIPVGSEFGVAILAGHPPAAGYTIMQVMLYYGELRYNPAFRALDEVVWPDVELNLRAVPFGGDPTGTEGVVGFGLLSDFVSPVLVSTYQGTIIELSMVCPLDPGTETLAIWSQPRRFSSYYSLETGLHVDPVAVDQRDLDLNSDGTIEPDEEDVALAAEVEVNCVEEGAS